MASISDVPTLLSRLHSSIEAIHGAVRALPDGAEHSAAIAKLEGICEEKIAEVRGRHEGHGKQLRDRRRREEEQMMQRRRKEEEEIMARRKKEDAERRARAERERIEREEIIREEDAKREKEREESERAAVRTHEDEIERLEAEMQRKWEEGRGRVKELDEKRKEINRRIDEMLILPTVFPKIQSRRAKLGAHRLSAQFGRLPPRTVQPQQQLQQQQQAPRRDAMVERLWSGERYAGARYFQGPMKSDAMLNRLWNGDRYPEYVHCRAGEDPMIERLWNGARYGPDAMLSRLWSDASYPWEKYAVFKYDPMMERLWSNATYNQKSESLWSTATHAHTQASPKDEGLWTKTTYPQKRHNSFTHDPTITRFASGAKQAQGKYPAVAFDTAVNRLWNEKHLQADRSHARDPMLARLFNGERYCTARGEDPMMTRLWAATRYREDAMLDRLSTSIRYREDSMLKRLSTPIRYREDAMINRLSAAARYRDDEMLDRLWNGASYSTKTQHERTSIEPARRQSAIFRAFFTSILSEIPLVNEYAKNQQYTTVPPPTAVETDDEQFHDFEAESSDYSDTEEEFPARDSTTLPPLRIRTPEHSHSAHASGASSPTTPSDTASHPFADVAHDERAPVAWSPPAGMKALSPLSPLSPRPGMLEVTNPSTRGLGDYFNSVPENPQAGWGGFRG